MCWLILMTLAPALFNSLVSGAPPKESLLPVPVSAKDQNVTQNNEENSIEGTAVTAFIKGISEETAIQENASVKMSSESNITTDKSSQTDRTSDITLKKAESTGSVVLSKRDGEGYTELEIKSEQTPEQSLPQTWVKKAKSADLVTLAAREDTTTEPEKQTESGVESLPEQASPQTSMEQRPEASEKPSAGTTVELTTPTTTTKPTTKKPKPKPKPPRATTVAEVAVTTAAPAKPTSVPVRPVTSKPSSTQRYPCRCGDGTCSCCTGIVLENFNVPLRSRACANVTYEPDDFAFNFKLAYNNIVLYNRRMSAKNPRPACIPINRYFGIKMCAKLSNVYMSGRNVHACLDFEGFFDDETAFKYSFNCFRIGSQGVAIVRPEDGGGLPPPPDEEEQTDEDYDDSA